MTEPQRAVPASLPAYLHQAHTYDAEGRVDGYEASCGEALCPAPGWTITGPGYVVNNAAWEHVRAHDEGTLRLTAELLRSAMHEARRYRGAWLSARRRARGDRVTEYAVRRKGIPGITGPWVDDSGPNGYPWTLEEAMDDVRLGCTLVTRTVTRGPWTEARSAQPDLEGTR